MIPQQFIDDLLRRVDVVEIVGQHVQLKKPVRIILAFVPSIPRSHPPSRSVQVSSSITALAVEPMALRWVF